MPFELKLAWKYFRTRRKGLVRWTSIVAVIGIATGVASLIVAQALSRGFADEIKGKVLQNTSHITVFVQAKTNISNWQIIKRQIEQIENVEQISPTTYESAIISSDKNSSYGVLRVESRESKSEKPKTKNQKPKTVTEISIGKELAEKLNIKIGNEAEIISFEDAEMPVKSSILINDIFETGLFEYDSTWIFLDEANYLKLKNTNKFSPKVFSITVKDIYQSDKTAENIKAKLGEEFKVLDWQEANKPLFAALSLERKVALAIIFLIIFIAVLNITTTLSLLVAERKLDIAVLRTCGAKTKNLMSLFLFEGIILSLCGIISGVILGLSVCFLANYFKIISLSKKVYSLNNIPLKIELTDIFLVIILTFLLSLLAIIYPTFKASQIKPLENLQMR